MHRLRATAIRFLNLFRRERVEKDLREQIDAHAQMLEEEFRSQGMDSGEARKAAKRVIGNGTLTRELMRDERFFSGLDSLGRDVRLAIRRLGKRPAVTLVSILALASGIGAAAATWSLLTAVLIKPLPVDDADRMYVVGTRTVRPDGTVRLADVHVYPIYVRVRDGEVFDAVAAGGALGALIQSGDRPVGGSLYFATHNFFELLGVRPVVGREFTPEDDRQGAPPVAVISNAYWRIEFGSDPDIVGREIRVAGSPVTIVGVAPTQFRGVSLSESPDVYLPLHTVADVMGTETYTNFFAEPLNAEGTLSSPLAWVTSIGRLRPGQDPEQARNRLDALWPEAVENGQTYRLTDLNTAAVPERVRDGMDQFIRLLGLTVALLLLIGCLAVGVLVLMQTEARRDELAMCLALGASRSRLARSIAVEGGLLTLGGTLLALPVSQWFFWGIQAFELPGGVRVDSLELTPGFDTLVAAAAGALTAMLFITSIAMSACVSIRLAHGLGSHQTTMPIGRRRTRAALVVGQVAIALALLAGTGLFARSIMAALSLNPDYDTEQIVTGEVNLFSYGYSGEQAEGFFEELGRRLNELADFSSVSLSNGFGGMSTAGKIPVDGVPRSFPSFVEFTGIDGHYFPTIGLSVIEGRDFSDYDGSDAPRVAIVSESLGRLLRNGNSPLGSRITEIVARQGNAPAEIEVVGVVTDIVTDVARSQPLVIYMPIEQLAFGSSTIREVVFRARGDTVAAIREAVNTIRAIDDAVTPAPFMTIDVRLGGQMRQQRFGMVVLGGLGTVALLLTALGIYVMAASIASGRRRELAIRSALGASGWRLGSIQLVQTTRLVGIGILLAFGLVWLGSGTIRAFLYGVEPLDSVTLVIVAGSMLALALLVSLKPVLSTVYMDVARTLREE